MAFARLWSADDNQLLVTIDTGEQGAPEVRFYRASPGFEPHTFAWGFDDNDVGWDLAEANFNDMADNEPHARHACDTNMGALTAPMKPFARLWGSDNDQVLMKVDAGEQGVPEVRFYFEPPGFGVCSVALKFENSDAGREKATAAFSSMTEDRAREICDGHMAALMGETQSPSKKVAASNPGMG